MVIKWTKSRRQKLTAIRHPHKTDKSVELFFESADDAWAWMRARRADNASKGSTVTATPEFSDTLDTVMQHYAHDAPPDVDDPIVELMRMVVLSHDGRDYYEVMARSFQSLVALWMERGGPAFVASMLEVEAPFAFLGRYQGDMSTVELQPLEPNPHGHKHLVRVLNGGGAVFENAFWMALRGWLFQAPESVYAQALEAFAPRRAALIGGRTSKADYEEAKELSALDFAFSRDPVWATEDARAHLSGERQMGYNHAMILAGLTDPVLAVAYAKEAYITPFELVGHGSDIVESLGEDALGVLEAYEARGMSMNAAQKRQLASLLKFAGKA